MFTANHDAVRASALPPRQQQNPAQQQDGVADETIGDLEPDPAADIEVNEFVPAIADKVENRSIS